jgi:hypothetical protein
MTSSEVQFEDDLVPLVKHAPIRQQSQPQYPPQVEAGRDSHELTAYTQQPVSGREVVPFDEVLRIAAMRRYRNIKQLTIDGKSKEDASSTFRYNLCHFGDPKATLNILTDVRGKEYTNRGAEPDTIEMGICRKRESCLGIGFKFRLLQGIDIDDSSRIGPSIFNATGSNVDNLLLFNEDDTMSDKAVVAPGVKMTTTVKTSLMKYEGEAVIDVQAPANCPVKFKYLTPSCPCDICLKWYNGTVTLEEMFQGQPNFRRVGSSVFYTAKYHYTYFGEQFEVNKSEEKLNHAYDQ